MVASGDSRQSRAAERQRARPRTPTRGRGVTRHATLLDATEALLREHSPDEVGLYQIAKAAGVPTASVYHFFPTKEAAFTALVQRYIAGFTEIGSEPIDVSRLQSWQDLMAIEQQRARDYYSSHPPAMKLLYGGFGGLESRAIDNEYVSVIAERMYARYDQVFKMPYIADPEKHFHISLVVLDAIWSLSYLKHAQITDEYAREALAACVAYCQRFLPDRVQVREHIRDLALLKQTYAIAV